MASWKAYVVAALLPLLAPATSFALDETLTEFNGKRFFQVESDDTGWTGPVRKLAVGNGRTSIRFQQGAEQAFCFFDASIPGFQVTNPTCHPDSFSVELDESNVSEQLETKLRAFAADGHFVKLAHRWSTGLFSLDPLPQNFGPPSMISNDISRLNRIESLVSVDLKSMGPQFEDVKGFIVNRGTAESITGFYRRPGTCGAVTLYTKGTPADLALKKTNLRMTYVSNVGRIWLVAVSFEKCNHRKFTIEILGDKKNFAMTADEYKEDRRLIELGNAVLSDMSLRMRYISLLVEFDTLLKP